MTVLTTWEGMPIPVPEGQDRQSVTARLLTAAEVVPFPAFRVKKGRLCAAEVVGSIQVGGVRINVLPKTDTPEEDRDADFLLNILRAAGYLNRVHASSGAVRASVRDPLEAMISEVASEMSMAMKEGIPRRYQEKREDSTTLRGRIDFTRLSTRLPSDHTVLPVRHTPLTADNDLAHCLGWIATMLLRLTRSSVNRQLLASMVARLNAASVGSVGAPQFAALRLSPSEIQWERVLAIGRLILQGRFADPTFSGANNAFSMLFPLQHLFERAMRRILADVMREHGIRVGYRAQPLFLLHGHDDDEKVLRLKPDYLFHREADLLAVADAKWKRLTEGGRAHGVGRDDLYQINAYLDKFDVQNAIVFMPRASWMTPMWTARYSVPHSGRMIHLVGVDIESLVSHRKDVREGARSALGGLLAGLV